MASAVTIIYVCLSAAGCLYATVGQWGIVVFNNRPAPHYRHQIPSAHSFMASWLRIIEYKPPGGIVSIRAVNEQAQQEDVKL